MIQLSVIIPTRNRCQSLKGVLESILAQNFPKENFEVIVVDNGSKDETKSIVEGYSSKINLQYYYDDRPGLHIGRNDGIRLSKGDILVFADDDIEAFPTWLEGIYDSFLDESVFLVGGKNLPKYEENPPFWILEKWYCLCNYGHCVFELSILDFGNEIKEIPPYYVFGCNFSIRKQVLLNTEGFHPDGMPFDLIRYRGDGETYVSNFLKEKNLKTLYNPQASIYHLVPKERLTIDYFCKRAFCQGISDSYSHLRNHNNNLSGNSNIKKWKKIIRTILGIESVTYLKKFETKFNMTDYEKRIYQSYTIGYSYHQEQYKRDKSIREWVHKDNYLS